MNLGKCQESVLKRSVLRQLHKRDKSVVNRPGIGKGGAIMALKDTDYLFTHTEIFTGQWMEIADVLVPAMAMSAWTKGAVPQYLQMGVMLGEATEEEALRRLMQRIDQDCALYNIEVTGGHTEIVSGAREITVSATIIGFMDQIECKKIQPGDDILVTGYVGLYGTSVIYHRYKDELEKRYYPDFLKEVDDFTSMFSIKKACDIARQYDTSMIYGIAKNGIFGALWEVAVAGQTGFTVDLKKIPLMQQTVEICNHFDVNPYLLSGYGSVIIATADGDHVKKALNEQGIAASVIGRFEDNHDKVIMNDDEKRYLDLSKRSELWTFLKED